MHHEHIHTDELSLAELNGVSGGASDYFLYLDGIPGEDTSREEGTPIPIVVKHTD